MDFKDFPRDEKEALMAKAFAIINGDAWQKKTEFPKRAAMGAYHRYYWLVANIVSGNDIPQTYGAFMRIGAPVQPRGADMRTWVLLHKELAA